jgi:hypothetical protein
MGPFGSGKKKPSTNDRIRASIAHLVQARKERGEEYVKDEECIRRYQHLLGYHDEKQKGKLDRELNREVRMFDAAAMRRDAQRVKADENLERAEIRAEREEAATEREIREKIERLVGLANYTKNLCNEKIIDTVARHVPLGFLNIAIGILKETNNIHQPAVAAAVHEAANLLITAVYENYKGYFRMAYSPQKEIGLEKPEDSPEREKAKQLALSLIPRIEQAKGNEQAEEEEQRKGFLHKDISDTVAQRFPIFVLSGLEELLKRDRTTEGYYAAYNVANEIIVMIYKLYLSKRL